MLVIENCSSIFVDSPESKILLAEEFEMVIVGAEGIDIGCLTAVEYIRSR
jgi:hypothetical protein